LGIVMILIAQRDIQTEQRDWDDYAIPFLG